MWHDRWIKTLFMNTMNNQSFKVAAMTEATTDSLHAAIHTWMQQVWNSFIIEDIFIRGAWARIRACLTPKVLLI